MLTQIGITFAIALGTAVIQTIVKGISRSSITNKTHGLNRDDALFWSDWVIAGTLAFWLAVLVSHNQNRPIPTASLVIGPILMAVSCSAYPFLLRVFAYDTNAQIKAGWPRGWGAILSANIGGMLILGGYVALGASVYEWN